MQEVTQIAKATPEAAFAISKAVGVVREIRAKDRNAMADLVEDVVCHAGAIYEREYDDQYKTIVVRIKAPGGLRLNFDIDGRSSLGDNAFVLPWYMDYQVDP